MSVVFPATPEPSGFVIVYSAETNGIFYPGDTVTFSFHEYYGTSTVTGYTVRDYEGNILSSGSVTGTHVTPTVPVGGWQYGWYRLFLTGNTSDSVFGNSRGAYNFCVVRADDRFPDNVYTTPFPGQGEGPEPVLKCVMGMGIDRTVIARVDTCRPDYPEWPGVPPGSSVYTGDSLWAGRCLGDQFLLHAPADPSYPMRPFAIFPNGGYDHVALAAGDASLWMNVFPFRGDLDTNDLFVRVEAGTTGKKLTVSYPDAGTDVEVFDNLTSGLDAAASINATSDYIWCASENSGNAGNQASTNFYHPAALSPGAHEITPVTYREGLINAVEYLYPYGIHYFEGPANEFGPSEYTAHLMKLFQSYVHQGHPDAVAMGPAFVSLSGWEPFLAAGGGDYCDEIATHAYNAQDAADFTLGNHTIGAWVELLTRYGLEDKPRWITESTMAGDDGSPRQARRILMMILQWEQYGVPRNRNLIWYDLSHGFWSVPSWSINTDKSLASFAPMMRVLSQETWDMPFHHAIDFGSVQANNLFLGNVYKSFSGESTVAVISLSSMDGASVTFHVDGTTDPLTMVDKYGNEDDVAIVGSEVTINVAAVPTYLRLPVGATIYTATVNGWETASPMIQSAGRATLSGTTWARDASDGMLVTNYGGGGGIISSSASLPDTAELMFNSTVDVDRVLIWCGPAQQPYSAFLDFDVQTTTNGVDWTTRETVTKDTPITFRHGTNWFNTGRSWYDYWDHQWVFDVPLPSTYSCTGIRLYVRETSFGGQPTEIMMSEVGAGGPARISLVEIGVPSLSTPTPFSSGYTELILSTSGLVEYWKLDDDGGETTAVAEVDADNHNGTYVYERTSGTNTIEGVLGFCTYENSVVIPASADYEWGDTFSVEFWMNAFGDNITTYSRVFAFGTGSGGTVSGTWRPESGVTMEVDGTDVCKTSVTIQDASWHHVVMTKDGSDAIIYCDGVDVTDPIGTATGTNIVGPLVLNGNYYPYLDSFIRGTDEWAVYNVALTPSQVTDHYLAASIPSTVPELVLAPAVSGAW